MILLLPKIGLPATGMIPEVDRGSRWDNNCSEVSSFFHFI